MKTPIQFIAIEGAGEAVCEVGGIASTGEERINVARFVRAREEVINPPHINRTIIVAGKILVSVVGSCNRIDMAIGKLHCGQCSCSTGLRF